MGETSQHHIYNIYQPNYVGFAQDNSALTYENTEGPREIPSETLKRKMTAEFETEPKIPEESKVLHSDVKTRDKTASPHTKAEKRELPVWKTDLYRVLWHEENINTLHNDSEYPQALGIHEGLRKFTSSQKDIGFLMNYCLTSMLIDEETQAYELFNKLVVLCRSLGETFHSVLSLAETAIKLNKNFDAIMLCMIAARICDRGNFTLLESAYKSKCMAVLRTATGNVSKISKRSRPFIQRYCVEEVRPLFEDVMKTGSGGSKNPIDLKIATFHCMEIIQLYADDDEGRAKTTERALQFLRETYGEEVYRRKWYGILSHNLGCTYLKLSRNAEAASMLVQAFDVLKSATDFDDGDEEQQNMSNTKNMLKATGLGGLINVNDYI